MTRTFRLATCCLLTLAAACGSSSKASTPKSSTSADTGTNATATTTAGNASTSVTDACALLTLDQVHAVVPDATAGEAKSSSAAAASEVRCYYGSNGTTDSLTVAVESTKVSADELKMALHAEDGAQGVPGLGDDAIVVTMPIDVEVKALFGTTVLRVELNGSNAAARKDAVVALAKQAASKL